LYDTFSKYDAEILTGDFNTKCGKGKSNQEVAGKYKKYEVTSGNGHKLIEFAQIPFMFVVSTMNEIK
jgi:hypothetical protein